MRDWTGNVLPQDVSLPIYVSEEDFGDVDRMFPYLTNMSNVCGCMTIV